MAVEPNEIVSAVSIKAQKECAAYLRSHPELLESLAAKIPQLVQEKLTAIVGGETAEALKRAQRTVDRTKAASAVGIGRAGSGRPEMDREQRAEWLRCAIGGLYGRRVVPSAELDAGGLITQALNPVMGSSGAYLLPDEFVPEVERKADEPAVIWPLLQKRQTRSRLVQKPEVTSYVAANKGTAANVNSATTATEITVTEPVYSELEWHLEDFDTRVPVKLDLLEESPISIYDELIWQVADAFAINHEQEPMVGTGHANKRPLGLLNAGAGITSTAIDAAPSVDNILAFIGGVPQRYRARATLAMPSTTFFKVVAALATDINSPEFLTRYKALPPLVESFYIPEGKLVAGDFNYYVVYHIRLMQLIQGIAAERKTMEIVVTETWTGRPTITDAFRIGTGVSYS